jgi:hypothetical protein
MPLNIASTRDRLQKFEFARLFVDELGWSNPKSRNPIKAQARETSYSRTPIAQLAGVIAFEVTTGDGIPDAKTRAAIQKQVAEEHLEHLLIFLDAARTQSLWYWVKRQSGKTHARDHLYVKGQPGDLFLSKLAALVVDISELDAEGNIPVTEVANRLKAALDVERVTKKFYGEFDTQRLAFVEHIQGISDDHQRRWYASVLMNRLMFIWFLQRKGFLDGADRDYLTHKLAASKKRGADKFYSVFLRSLFFEGFALPEPARSPDTRALLGKIRYLNGGLFLPHRVELSHGFPDKQRIKIADVAFDNIFALFSRYSWNLNDTPGGDDQEINPDVLGYIFEKYINQKEFGAYYTRPEMTGYLCERTIYKLVLDRVNKALGHRFATISDLLLNLDANLCRLLLFESLPSLRLLDPACGSAAFLVAAMKVLIAIYSAVIGKVQFLNDVELAKWHKQTQADHPSVLYFIKKQIITTNLFGVDIMEEATEIARLRLFLALVASAQTEDQLEPLPNIDFNILAGNSLIGLLRVDEAKFDAGQAKSGGAQERMTLQHGSDLGFTVESKTAPTKEEKAAAFVAQQNAARFAAILEDKNKSIELYRKHAFQPGEKDGLTQEERLIALRSHIENVREQSYARLNQLLLDEFTALGVEFQQAVWDEGEKEMGKSDKRSLKKSDIEALHPFHWGYEFDKVMADGGFDGIITNPPWEIFKPNSKEFFEAHSELVSKKKMAIHDFEKEQTKLLRDSEIRQAWLEYLSGFPHLSAYYRSASQFKNQISMVNGKKAGSDTNLYKLFLEQCHNLLRAGGRCGIVIPSGIYTDLGTKQLREMLFSESHTDTIFGLSNERFIFEEVHHAFKFCLLSFEKGGKTDSFSGAFRINPREAVAADQLESFLHSPSQHLTLQVEMIRRLSPDSISVMEFKTPLDVVVAEKMLKFPLLGDEVQGRWILSLNREFDMTNDSHLFKSELASGRLPLFEGKMIWHFEHQLAEPRFWVSEKEARKAILGKEQDRKQKLDYESCRLGIRAVSGSVNERTLVTSIIPPNVFCGNSILASRDNCLSGLEILFATSFLNSFVVDSFIRQKVSQNINMFYIYQLPVPRLAAADSAFGPIVQRAARLVCTTPEFDALAKEVSAALKLPPAAVKGVTDATTRARLRAELDGLIAHLYGLTESEFAHILTTFPLVSEPVKLAARNAYRDVDLGLIK